MNMNDHILSEDQRMMRDTVRAYIDDVVAPYIRGQYCPVKVRL